MISFIFDVDDTLYDQMIPFVQAYEEMFGGKYEITGSDLYVSNSKYSNQMFELTQSGQMAVEDMHAARITNAFSDFHVTISREEALTFQGVYARKLNEIQMTEDVTEILRYCKEKGNKIGVITNGPSAHQWNKVKNLDVMRWVEKEFVFVSGDLKITKPDAAIFRHVEKQMNLIPEATYYVGDSFANDVIGAKGAGWKSIWFNRRNYPVREGDVQPDYCVYTEKELSDLIRSLNR